MAAPVDRLHLLQQPEPGILAELPAAPVPDRRPEYTVLHAGQPLQVHREAEIDLAGLIGFPAIPPRAL